jgi:hypothetical protein
MSSVLWVMAVICNKDKGTKLSSVPGDKVIIDSILGESFHMDQGTRLSFLSVCIRGQGCHIQQEIRLFSILMGKAVISATEQGVTSVPRDKAITCKRKHSCHS